MDKIKTYNDKVINLIENSISYDFGEVNKSAIVDIELVCKIFKTEI
jgi:hypothetical protein